MTIILQSINTGSSANAGDGDSLRTAFNKINNNFSILSTATDNFVLTTATTSTLGGVIVGLGLAINTTTGVLSATGEFTTSTVYINDQTGAPSVNIISYSGSTSLTTGSVTLFNFDQTVYRSAIIDISANNFSLNTDDVASGYVVTRNATVSTALGSGVISINALGNTSNAEWDLSASNSGNLVNVQMINPIGSGAVGHVINWRAKVSLFRL